MKTFVLFFLQVQISSALWAEGNALLDNNSKSYFVWYIVAFFLFEAMAVDRLKGVVKFLEQCRGAHDFETIQKKQYDVLLQELEQVLADESWRGCGSLESIENCRLHCWHEILLGEDSPREGLASFRVAGWFCNNGNIFQNSWKIVCGWGLRILVCNHKLWLSTWGC